ncbi:MAG: hypothetical protein AAGH89_11110 [Verrucomicrobiota bacterium]
MSASEIESAVMALPAEDQLRIADQIWDRIKAESEEDAETIAEMRSRIDSEEFDGALEIEAAKNRRAE